MKIIYLNAWDATIREPFIGFITQHAEDTDIFCIQEADSIAPAICDELLDGYSKLAAHKFVTEKDNFYLATYFKKDIKLASSGALLEDEQNVGLGQYLQIKKGLESLYVCNFHGMSRPTDKQDTPERFRQSQGLIEFFRGKPGPKVIGGDFNAFPSNQWLQLFQANGYRDLIAECKITNTRNHYVWDRYPENPKQYFSDYVFVDGAAEVDGFVVPDVEVSDHLPLILTIS